VRDAKLPFGNAVRSKALAVARLNRGLVGELPVHHVENQRLVVFSKAV